MRYIQAITGNTKGIPLVFYNYLFVVLNGKGAGLGGAL
jgi:hypothetical protein